MRATKELRLDCTRCVTFTTYATEPNGTVVRCEECGKRHSDDSLYMVDPDRSYDRDDDGRLLEDLP